MNEKYLLILYRTMIFILSLLSIIYYKTIMTLNELYINIIEKELHYAYLHFNTLSYYIN